MGWAIVTLRTSSPSSAGSAAPFSVAVGGASTTALAYPAESARATVILGHGAGAPQTHPWMVKMATALSRRGIDVVTFNFLYAEARRRAPDRNDVLEATWRAVVGAVRARTGASRLLIGGKSMGGRIATQVAAQGDVHEAGLILLGYPLHPPGQPAKLRAAHLPRVSSPMLFVQGSRDSFGTPEELRPVLEGLASGTRLLVVEGADHSLSLPKSSGQTLDGTLARVADEVVGFIGSR
jgi:predicted alpha/beta-hydrolase family hydrolase